jgi:hypothetical protein
LLSRSNGELRDLPCISQTWDSGNYESWINVSSQHCAHCLGGTFNLHSL